MKFKIKSGFACGFAEQLARGLQKLETALKFEKIKTCEFKKDSVFIFARTNYSFHGVEEVNINKAERNLFLVNFYGDKNTNG